MNAEQRQKLEEDIQRFHDDGDFHAATTAALKGYGPEILGFLMGVTHDPDLASELFSHFSENLWLNIEKFQWRSSFRTWVYTLARTALSRHFNDPYQKRGRRLLTHELNRVEEAVRTRTLMHLRSSVKDRMRSLRDSLKPVDQTLLILRIDRRMDWREVAQIMIEEDEPDTKALKKKAAALRKRFERLKEKLRELAEKEGLI